MNNNNNKNIEKIKKVFDENFLRKLSDAEAEVFLKDVLSYTREELSKTLDFNEQKFNQYVFNSELEIFFSPRRINDEIVRIIESIGIETLEKSYKYKRASEMVSAMCLALALKKLSGKEWAIKSQDSPDIILVKRNDRGLYDKPFDALAFEIMEIPEQEKQNFGLDIERGIAEFIKDKKFMKRYLDKEKIHLFVYFNFNQMGINLQKVSEILQSFLNNPYHQIWIRTNTDPTKKLLNVTLIYPKFRQVDIDVEKEYPNLMF
ncbi:MAG: hypothetical protein WC514_01750 [Candidatus Paceibacterota bacterium]